MCVIDDVDSVVIFVTPKAAGLLNVGGTESASRKFISSDRHRLMVGIIDAHITSRSQTHGVSFHRGLEASVTTIL